MLDFNKFKQASSLESLLEGLDQRGLLVLQVLLGQQAMKLLSEDHVKKVTNASDTGKISLPT